MGISPTWNSARSWRFHGHCQGIGSGRTDEGPHRAEVDQGAVQADDAAERDQVVLEAYSSDRSNRMPLTILMK
jgi:hypothetical protein